VAADFTTHAEPGPLDAAAGDINLGIERLSQRTSDQAASLEQTASSMEEMTVTVKRNADNARTLTDLIAAFNVLDVAPAPVEKVVKAAPAPAPMPKKVAGPDCEWQEF
jgi:methyl-accepting chemotaxis protein